MRLPTAEGEAFSANILEAQAIKNIRHAIDSGVNYVDSAYRYHGGASEVVLGKALKDGYRQKVKLATKAPMPSIKTAADYDRILDEQLTKLDVDYIDNYLFHGLNAGVIPTLVGQDLFGRAEAAKKAGKIRHIGFSFHDKYEVFEKIIGLYDKWDFCMMQYNFMDIENQAGTKGVKLAASKGLGVVAMEPLRGGKLGAPIKEAADCMQRHGYEGTLADLALRWVWNQPEISLALSGMTTMEQVEQNLVSAQSALPGCISDKEQLLIDELREIYRRRSGVPCTGCSYCMPCPQNVNIVHNFMLYNEGAIYEYFDESRRLYPMFGKTGVLCTKCGECEAKCPQGIPISEWMNKIHEILV